MILKRKSNKTAFSFLPYLIPLLLVLVTVGYFSKSLQKKELGYSDRMIYCDAEKVNAENFISGKVQFQNGITQSSERSYSGEYSSKVGGDHKYGMSFTVKDVKPNTRYIATVKRYTHTSKSSALVISGKPGKNLYKKCNVASKKLEDGWELLSLKFNVTEDMDCNEVTVYVTCHNPSHTAYFDDLTIQEVELESTFFGTLPSLHIYLDNKASHKINNKRDEAVEQNLLQTEDDDWVKAKLTVGDSLDHDVSLRLKGDAIDHLSGDTWSYRVKMPSDKSWNRLQTFSLQNPQTRYYLHEWIYHKALEKVDVITPRYGFVKLAKNNAEPKLYAFEEHFEKHIAEFRNRREGVIVKFAEDHLWSRRLRNDFDNEENIHRDVVKASNIVPFKQSKLLKNPKLLEQFEYAQDLMHAFKMGQASASEVFDIELLAKYLAITDIFNANHGLNWHNLRFYYNPITRKLEPIGFDGYMETGALKNYNDLFFGEFKSGKHYTNSSSLFSYIYGDPDFIRAYVPYMVEYSSGDFISKLLDDHKEEMFEITSIIHKFVDVNYAYDENEVRLRAQSIFRNIIPYNENSLRVYKEISTGGSHKYYATNLHNLPLEILGSGNKKTPQSKVAQGQIICSNTPQSPFDYTEINVNKGDKYVYYKLPGTDQVLYTTINKWSRPSSQLNTKYSSGLEPKIPLDSSDYIVNGKTITILEGKYSVTNPIIIPKGYSLNISAGTEIDFLRKAYLLSYSPVFLNGTEEEPILIKSSDKSSQGVTVIQADQQSILNYVSFINLNTLEENEWQMTGAVTFYESDLLMNSVSISHNLCEDGLNLIRSSFSIYKLSVSNTFADGFDGDFCSGTLENSYFTNTGNDALDYSGSVVDVSNVHLTNIGDKGISAGEQSSLTLKDVNIENAQIGIASKDLSNVEIENLSLKNCAIGFAAYRKKPEFGGATIKVVDFTQQNIERLTQLDEESTIVLPNQ